jgi:pimeloyl-ACP methyl ester carboxylesterase
MEVMNFAIYSDWVCVKRAIRQFFSVSCSLLLASTVVGALRDIKVEQKIVRADDGLKLVYEDQGEGDTALVFLHGWGGDRQYWKNQVNEFAADYRVIAYDQAGHSQSGKTREHWTVSSLAGDVESVAKALGLKRMILVGHSMGGPVALMAAKRMPGKVVGVVAVDTLQNAEFKRPEEATKKFLADFEADFQGTVRITYSGLLPKDVNADLQNWLSSKAEARIGPWGWAYFVISPALISSQSSRRPTCQFARSTPAAGISSSFRPLLISTKSMPITMSFSWRALATTPCLKSRRNLIKNCTRC